MDWVRRRAGRVNDTIYTDIFTTIFNDTILYHILPYFSRFLVSGTFGCILAVLAGSIEYRLHGPNQPEKSRIY